MAEETTNLYAIYGNQKPNICFAGHVDVVPAMHEDLWKSDPYEMTILDDNVYGRGAVDMKGAIAWALASVAQFLKNNKPGGSIIFLLKTEEEGDETSNVIPESAKAKFNVRFNDLQSAKNLNIQITEIVSKYSDNYDIKYTSSSNPFIQQYSDNMREFSDIFEHECGIKPNIETGGGTSDARFIHSYTEVVKFGLNCNLAHKINEHTKISDLQTLYNVYYNTLVKLL